MTMSNNSAIVSHHFLSMESRWPYVCRFYLQHINYFAVEDLEEQLRSSDYDLQDRDEKLTKLDKMVKVAQVRHTVKPLI